MQLWTGALGHSIWKTELLRENRKKKKNGGLMGLLEIQI